MPNRCNRCFYCRSYCLLHMFRAPLCPSSGAQEYYMVVAACGIWCCGFQVVVLVWSWGLCVQFAGCCSTLQTGYIKSTAKFTYWSSRDKIKLNFVVQCNQWLSLLTNIHTSTTTHAEHDDDHENGGGDRIWYINTNTTFYNRREKWSNKVCPLLWIMMRSFCYMTQNYSRA